MSFVNFILEQFLSFSHLIFSDWGMAIVMLALAIRVLLFPIQTFNFIQQRRMQEIQPELDKVSEEFKGDPRRAYKAIQALKNKVGIKTSALLIFNVLQIPIFFGIYQTMTAVRSLSEVPFLWISSLSLPDALYVLPLMVAVTTYLQLRNSKTQPAMLNKLLPAVNFVFMASMPSALVLYYATSGLFQVASEAVLRKILA